MFKDTEDHVFLERILARTGAIHGIFGSGKSHSLAKDAMVEFEMPFRVTVTWAKQRFLSSAFRQIESLLTSLPGYIMVMKRKELDIEGHDATYDDNNAVKEIPLYKIGGQDFLFDLLAVTDLLKPMVIFMLRSQSLSTPGWRLAQWIEDLKNHIEKFINGINDKILNEDVFPLLSKNLADIKKFKFKSGGKGEDGNGYVTLVKGWLVVDEDATVLTWKCRQLADCRKEVVSYAQHLLDSIKARENDLVCPLMRHLEKCLNFGTMFKAVVGVRDDAGIAPKVKETIVNIGSKEFKRVVTYVSQLPDVFDAPNLEIKTDLSEQIFWGFKEFIIETVWNERHFRATFPKIFQEIYVKEKKRSKFTPENADKQVELCLRELKIPEGTKVIEFTFDNSSHFDLTDKFFVKLSDGSELHVALCDEDFIFNLFENPNFYTEICTEFLVCYERMYSKLGTEAIAETYYKHMSNQEQEGGQSLDILSARSKLEMSLPDITQCDDIINDTVALYINGDKSLGLKPHHVPVYRDSRSLQLPARRKVLKRHINQQVKLTYLIDN